MSTVTAGPERYYEQRRDALKRANEIRLPRAAIKRDLKAGRASIVSLLQEPPECLATMEMLDLLMALPKIGRVKAWRMLNRCGVSPARQVRFLSAVQRRELLSALSARRLG